MVIEMPNLKPHTIGYKAYLIDECVKEFINHYSDKGERVRMTKHGSDGFFVSEVVRFFLMRTTYAPKYVKNNYLETIRQRVIMTQ